MALLRNDIFLRGIAYVSEKFSRESERGERLFMISFSDRIISFGKVELAL